MEQMFLDENQIRNCINYMEKFIQRKHLLKMVDVFNVKTRVRLVDWYDDIISAVLFGLIDFKVFCNWLSTNQIDGGNHFFVYDADLQNISESTFQKYLDHFNLHYTDVLNVNTQNLKQTTLINVTKLENKYILCFLSPAQVSKKITTEDGLIKSELMDIMFPGFVEFDLNQKSVLVILNPVSNLDNVEGVKLGKYNSYTPVVDLFLKYSRKILGAFYVKKPNWLSKSLHSLTEEATYHNNPEIENKQKLISGFVEKFSTRVLHKNNIDDESYIYYLTEEIKSCLEVILLEELGNKNNNEIGIFLQKTDQTCTSIEVAGITQNINTGTAGRVAKQSRQDSEVNKLGIDIKIDDYNRQRFMIERGSDHILIHPYNNTFTEREAVLYVLSKLYKHKTRTSPE
ncbi:hypothetical protein ABE137_11000 [Brevibacillus laterosporus]|uniref:hypothetical protein n=1 Tax=Brevibacillus laterosporus TaxID=1465 RepID=UPI003D24F2ED